MTYNQKKYIKNSEIAEILKVSATSVLNWVQLAKEGKNDLELELVGKKEKVVDSEHNWMTLRNFGNTATNYRNKSQKATVTPTETFLKYFDFESTVEIIKSLETDNILPVKYSTMGKGAKIWEAGTEVFNKITRQYALPEHLQLLNGVGNLLNLDQKNTRGSKSLTIYLLYPKFWLEVDTLLSSLSSHKDKVKSVVIVDKSIELLESFAKKINEKYPAIVVQTYIKDLEKENLTSLFFANYDPEITNLVYLGFNALGFFNNQNIALENLKYSLKPQDYLISINEVDNYLNSAKFGYTEDLEPYTWILKEMGVDVDKCQVVNRYEDKTSRRNTYVVLDKDYTIEIQTKEISYTLKLDIESEIRVCSQKMINKIKTLDNFLDFGFDFIKLNCSASGYHMLLISSLKQSN